jgi:membrane protein required for colicin V production
MSSIDIIFIIFLGLFVLIGVFRGFLKEILGFVGILGGIFLSIIGFKTLGSILIHYFPDIPGIILMVGSFILIFLVVYFFSRLLASFLSRLSEKMHLSWLNRILGGAVGGIKGAILISFILFLMGFLPFQETLTTLRQDSIFFEPIQRLLPTIYDLTTSFSTSSREFEKKLKNSLESGKIKTTEEMSNYLFKRKQDFPDVK